LCCRYTPLQVAAGVGVAATVLAGGVAASKSSAVSDALSEQADLAWERLESVVPPLQVRTAAWIVVWWVRLGVASTEQCAKREKNTRAAAVGGANAAG
jgi:hypothetical protein